MHVKDQHGANLTIIGKPTQCLITDQFNFQSLLWDSKKRVPPPHTHHEKGMFLKSWLLSNHSVFNLSTFWVFTRGKKGQQH